MTMTKYQYRLLDSCLEGYVPLFQRRLRDFALGLTREQAVAVLSQMFLNEELLAFPRIDVPKVAGGDLLERIRDLDCLFVPSPKQIELALSIEEYAKCEVLYAIGPRGAEIWEEFINPSWDTYIMAQSQFIEDSGPRHENELQGQRGRIDQALEQFYPDRLQGTEYWRTFSPWHATYWKTLPEAVGVTFRTHGDAPAVILNLKGEWFSFLEWYEYPAEFIEPDWRRAESRWWLESSDPAP